MYEIIETSYHPTYVILSVLCAVMGAYTALTVVYRLLAFRHAQIHRRLDVLTRTDTASPAPLNRRTYVITLLLAGLAFGGLGVWVMHFVGSMGLNMHMPVSYSLRETALSLLVATLGATLGLGILAVNPYSTTRLLVAGCALSLGVIGMHYVGMHSMRFGGFFLWDWRLVAVSCAIALVASTIALWLAFTTSSNTMRLIAAMVMGGAVSAMHYTGMAAGTVCSTSNTLSDQDIASLMSVPQMPMLLAMGVLLIVFTLLMDRMFLPRDR